jgi:hypothetical protein
MPHTWVGCIFVHALRTMLVHERDTDQALVIGAGIPASWAARGVSARRMPTTSGILSFTLRMDGPDAVRVHVAGDLAVPHGGIVVTSPLDRPIRRVSIDNRPLTSFTDAEATIDRCPADVVLHYDPQSAAVPTPSAAGG